jgi:predicted dehydrogenase
MIRHHPQWHAVQTLIANGDLGQLQAIDIQFSFYEAEPTNIRNQKHLGGGSLLDIGCYAVHVGQMLLGRPPISVDGAAQWDSPGGVDTHGTLFLDYGDTHLTARFGHRSAYAQEVTIYGSSRHARLPYPFTMPIDRSCQIILTRNSRSGWSEYETLTFPAMDQYKAMVSEVSRRILEDEEQVVPLADSIAVNSVLEAAVRRFEQCTR